MTQDQQHTRAASRAVLATRLAILAGMILGAFIVLLQLWTTTSTNEIARTIKAEQMAATKRGESIKATAEQVQSCTTPGLPCFERSKEDTAAAVGTINEVAVYAAACADKPRRQTVAQIQQCVIKQLAASQDTN